VWGVIWLIIAFLFFIAGVLVGIVAFKVSYPHKRTDTLPFFSSNFAWGSLLTLAVSVL
jgi:hypothetical protein